MLAPWPGATNRQLAKAFFGAVEESEDFRGSCGGHVTDGWHRFVADGKATGQADPSAANKAQALPLPVEGVQHIARAL